MNYVMNEILGNSNLLATTKKPVSSVSTLIVILQSKSTFNFKCVIALCFILTIFLLPLCQSKTTNRGNYNNSSLDCKFNELSNSQDSGFCRWRPTSTATVQLWHTGNAVFVDSANYVIPAESTVKNNRFAYVQGNFEANSEGDLESPLIKSNLNDLKELRLLYWKVAPLPTLDICLKNTADNSLNCVDSIAGPGQQQWVQRLVELPSTKFPYKVVLRARNILSAEDIICIDDIQLIDSYYNLPQLANVDTARRAEQNDNILHLHKNSDKFNMDYYSRMQSKVFNENLENRLLHRNADEENQELVKLKQTTVTPHPMLSEKIGKLRSSIIRPQTYQKSSTVALLKKNFLPQQQSSSFGTKTYHQQSNRPHSTLRNSLNFPEFSSFSEGLNRSDETRENHQWKALATVPEKVELCQALKCSFLESFCLWNLGPTWKKTDGTIVRDTAGTDFVVSALFKAPLGSFLEFDLWMSDDSQLMVIEDMDEPLHEQLTLFSHRGMANNGFHQFRVPLRPSFKPVRVKFYSFLPVGAFVTISNTRMVDNKNEEMVCETIKKRQNLDLNFEPSSLLVPEFNVPQFKNTAKPPIASFSDIFSANALPPLLPLPSSTQPQHSKLLSSALIPTTSSSPFQFTVPTLASIIPTYDPFKPMLENGLIPIVPQKNDPHRLTALQKMTTLPTPPQQPKTRGMSANEALQKFTNMLPNIFLTSPEKKSAELQKLHDLYPEEYRSLINEKMENKKGFLEEETRSIDKIIGSIAGQPVLEQQLRHLAKHLGFDAKAVPDRKTLDTLRRFFGAKLLSLPTNDKQNIISMSNGVDSVNLTSIIPTLSFSQQSQKEEQNPPPSPFEAPEVLLLPKGDNIDVEKKTDNNVMENLFTNMSPIKPINDEMNFVHKEETTKHPTKSVMATGTLAPNLNALLLNRLATFFKPPSSSADPQIPLTKENLDFVFQNALNG